MPREDDSVSHHFDDVLRYVGEFGLWQKFLYFSSCFLVIVPSALQIASLVFATGTPKFQCVTPNVTCKEGKCCDDCTDYVFDESFTSTVTEWNLICDKANIAAIVQSLFVAGMMAGSLLFGAISDYFGRRFCLFLCSALALCFSLASSFVDCLSFFTFLRFCSGAAITGMFVGHYVYILELVGASYRTLAGKVQDVFWVLGACIMVLIAYLVRDWRQVLLIASFPAGFFFVLWRVFPESLRWLVTQGRLEDAHAILMKYAEKSSVMVDSETLTSMLEGCRAAETRVTSKIESSPLDLVRTPRMRKRTVILCYNWLVLNMIFYGIMLYVPGLAGNMYLNIFLMFVTDLPHTPMAWIVFKYFGRRVPHCMFMMISGFSCLLVLTVPEDLKGLITALAIIGRFFGSASFSNIYLYSTELYPTTIRNMALGTCSTFSRIGGIVVPFIVALGQLPGVSVTLPLVIIGVLTLIASLVSLWLPETLLSNMSETVADIESSRESYGVIWMGKPHPCPVSLPCTSCQDSEEQNVYVLTETSNKDHSGRSSEEPEDLKETTPLATTEDEPLETKPNV
ncbi:organic cation transporter protein-like [Oculina patagonica]